MRSTVTFVLPVLIICGKALAQAPSLPAGSTPDRVAASQGPGAPNIAAGELAALAAPQGLRFVPLSPCRIADTRNATGPFGGPEMAGSETRSFTLPSSSCGVPSTAQAFSLNIAVVPSGPLGFLTVWPAGQTRPLASTLNSLDGRVKSNAAIVPAGVGGAISVFASNPTHVILDINGYFVPDTDPTALAFFPVTPCRIADTRDPTGSLGGPSLTGGVKRTFPILSSACGIPAAAKAYSLNLTAVPPGPLGFLTAWPTGPAQPVVASLNALTGTVTANAAIVPAGTGGNIDLFASNTTHLVIDINGYFAPMAAGGLSLYTAPPCRVLDTRDPPGTPAFSGKKDVTVAGGACGVPLTAKAFVLGATVVPPGPLGFLTLWPQLQPQPTVATLNALDAAVTSNMAIVPTTNGSISAFPSNPVHLVLDVFGYFGPAAFALQSIAVTPANPLIAKTATQQFTATGTYTDASTQNLTTQVTWASVTPSVATITAGGLATGAGGGTSTITATLAGVSGSTVLTVTTGTLQSIAVTPANPSIANGATRQFTATGTYSDASTHDLTAHVTWASGTPSVATITSGGLATGAGAGTSTISATLGAVTGSTVLTVTTPTGSVTYTYDSQGRLATATYTNSSTGSVTVTYSYDAAGNRTSVVAQ